MAEHIGHRDAAAGSRTDELAVADVNADMRRAGFIGFKEYQVARLQPSVETGRPMVYWPSAMRGRLIPILAKT